MNRLTYNGENMENSFSPIVVELVFTETTTCELLLIAGYDYNNVIEWGDDSDNSFYNGVGENNIISHEYSVGNYMLKIYGKHPGLNFNNTDQAPNLYITHIWSWGVPEITNLEEIRLERLEKLERLPNENGGLKYIKNFNNCFNRCISLLEIPGFIFKYNTIATRYSGCFSGCLKITQIPKYLFKYNENITDLYFCFENTNITKIHKDLFINNPNLVDLESCFSNTNITSIPETLFDNNTEVTTFRSCFYGCEPLKSIPQNLFSNNIKVKDFSWCFYDCTSLSGHAPKLWDSPWTDVEITNDCFTHTNILGTNGTTIPVSYGGQCSLVPITNCSGL